MSATDGGGSQKLLGKTKGYNGDFCCVPDCSNSRGKCNRMGKKVCFYQFPKDEKRRDAWLRVIRRDCVIVIDGVEKTVQGVKVDIPGHQDYIPSVFPRNRNSSRQTKRSKLAGFTSLPISQSKPRKRPAESAISDVGRPKLPRKLDYYTVNSENAVRNTTDHNYVNPQLECVSDNRYLHQQFEGREHLSEK